MAWKLFFRDARVTLCKKDTVSLFKKSNGEAYEWLTVRVVQHEREFRDTGQVIRLCHVEPNQHANIRRKLLHEKTSKTLYSSDKKKKRSPDLNDSALSAFSENIISLENDDKLSCEGKVTRAECLKALKDFKNEKSPGTDGLQAEFYKYFWNELHVDMIHSFNFAFDSGSLSITQRRGIITLIPKPNKDTTLLDNLRPISLLNTDYKILTKIIAKRLEKVLPKIINPDQTGYVKSRYIGENVRLISDIMSYTEETNIPGIALFLDFKKAFDTIEWDFINNCLKIFNFGPDIQNWFKVLYNNVNSCVLNNGYASEFFSLGRGVRQGCPLSGLLFVIGIEILARAIKNDAGIKGIKVGEKEIKFPYMQMTPLFLFVTLILLPICYLCLISSKVS